MKYIHPVTQREYTISFSPDEYLDAPHLAMDGHGVVLTLDHDLDRYDYINNEYDELTDEDKMRMALYRKLGPSINTWDYVYYDYIGSLQRAINEWGCTEAEAPAVVEQDYRYLRGWYQGEWHWMVITATTVVDGVEFTNSIGGYESNIEYESDTLNEILLEITHEIEHQIREKYYAGQLELAFA